MFLRKDYLEIYLAHVVSRESGEVIGIKAYWPVQLGVNLTKVLWDRSVSQANIFSLMVPGFFRLGVRFKGDRSSSLLLLSLFFLSP